ncbi:hypothetical protein GCM10027299_54280 [Larkinella ripae]
MVGRAMFTMLLSSVDMKVPNMRVPRIIHLLEAPGVAAAGEEDTDQKHYFTITTA